MDYFIIIPLGGSGLFFFGIFILLLLEGASQAASTSAISFINEHIIAIAVVLGIIVLIVTILAVREYKEVHRLDHVTLASIFFTLGVFAVLAQLAFALVKQAFVIFSHYDGLFMLILRMVISIIAIIIDAILTASTIVLSSKFKGCIILMYLLAALGMFIRVT